MAARETVFHNDGKNSRNAMNGAKGHNFFLDPAGLRCPRRANHNEIGRVRQRGFYACAEVGIGRQLGPIAKYRSKTLRCGAADWRQSPDETRRYRVGLQAPLQPLRPRAVMAAVAQEGPIIARRFRHRCEKKRRLRVVDDQRINSDINAYVIGANLIKM